MFEFHAAKIGGRFVFSTGILTMPYDWDRTAGWVKNRKSKTSSDLHDIQDWTVEYMKSGNPTSDGLRSYLKDHLSNKESVVLDTTSDTSMLSKWQFFLDVKGKKVSKGTLKNYSYSRDIMEEFLTEKSKQKIRCSHFNNTLFEEFEGYLLKKYSLNTKQKVIKHFSMFCDFAVKDGETFGMDVGSIEYHEKSGRKISLSSKQLTELINLKNLSLKHAAIRDIMVVHCMIGLRVSDLFKINQTMIKDDVLFLMQKKTDIPVEIPLVKRVRDILQKYGWRLPKYSDQKYNDYLKEVYRLIDDTSIIEIMGEHGKAKKVLVCDEISSHDMVRTFITLSGEKGMTIQSIALIVGKSEQVIYRHYLNSSKDTAKRELIKSWDDV